MTDLAEHIRTLSVIDTHEHLWSERRYTEESPDVLQHLFDNYILADLVVAGATAEQVKNLVDNKNPDIAVRFAPIRQAWGHCQHTGYGEAVSLIAKHLFDMDEITLANIEAAESRNQELVKPGRRLHILKDMANLDHVQIDDFSWSCLPDTSGSDFFLYDISWVNFARGEVKASELYEETGIEVYGLYSLYEAMSALYQKYAACAIAVKSQHAYNRTLLWQKRDEYDVRQVLQKQLEGKALSTEESLCLGDWGLAKGVELAIQHNLPFKIHTGYHAGHSYSQVDHIKPGHLTSLLAEYPQARFVLMHIGYPYQEEIIALAKHYPNVYVDMCWSWSINPYAAMNFVRRFIHAAPINKLFGFGGDTFWPGGALAYSIQARQWLTRTLQAEVDDGLLTEQQAIHIASRLLHDNQQACFDIAGTRQAIAAI